MQVQCADTGEMQPVHIEAGSMVADRCVLLPGTRIGRGAVIGSGTLIPKGSTVENESVWLGSVNGKPALWQASFWLGSNLCTVTCLLPCSAKLWLLLSMATNRSCEVGSTSSKGKCGGMHFTAVHSFCSAVLVSERNCFAGRETLGLCHKVLNLHEGCVIKWQLCRQVAVTLKRRTP